MEQIRLAFSSESKFYDRKEIFPTKYHQIRSRLTVFLNFSSSPLSRQKELDADPKAIQHIELVGHLKKLDANYNAADAGKDQSMLS